MPIKGPIAIIGCGLIGGSLLKALHQQRRDLIAIDTDERARAAIRAELGVEATADPSAAGAAALVILALPVEPLLQLIAGLRGLLGSEVVVTDVAGIKVPVLEAFAEHLEGVAAIGGHPMAGKERGGFAASEPNLFRGKTVALCPGVTPSNAAHEAAVSLWNSVGAETLICSAEAHDSAVARVSHLPHLVAASLSSVAGRGDALSRELAASGLRDTTRVAEDPTIRQALERNPSVASLAREVARELLRYAETLDEGRSVQDSLAAAATARRKIFPS